MVQAQAILVDDETEPVVLALEGRSARLAIVLDTGTTILLEGAAESEFLRLLRQATYVSLDHAATLLGTAPVALKRLIRRGDLTAASRGDEIFVSLESVLGYRDRRRTVRREALDEMFRATTEGGLYDAELDPS